MGNQAGHQIAGAIGEVRFLALFDNQRRRHAAHGVHEIGLSRLQLRQRVELDRVHPPVKAEVRPPFLERIEQPDTIPAPFQTLVGDEPVFAFDIEDEQAFPGHQQGGNDCAGSLAGARRGDGDAVRFAAIGQAKWSEKFIRLPKVPRELPAVFFIAVGGFSALLGHRYTVAAKPTFQQ